MLNTFSRGWLFFTLMSVSFGALATDRDLIQTLYHADFTPDTDDEIPRFSLDGELGVLVNTGNTSAASVKAGVNADHETENWSSLYFALRHRGHGSELQQVQFLIRRPAF